MWDCKWIHISCSITVKNGRMILNYHLQMVCNNRNKYQKSVCECLERYIYRLKSNFNFIGIKMFTISDAKFQILTLTSLKFSSTWMISTWQVILVSFVIFIQSILTFLIVQTVVSCLFIYVIKFLKNVDQVETEKCQQSQIFIPKNSDNNSHDFKPWSYPKASL